MCNYKINFENPNTKDEVANILSKLLAFNIQKKWVSNDKENSLGLATTATIPTST